MPSPLVQTTGRRKEAVARVRLRPGSGVILVNRRPIDDYFPTATHRMVFDLHEEDTYVESAGLGRLR